MWGFLVTVTRPLVELAFWVCWFLPFSSAALKVVLVSCSPSKKSLLCLNLKFPGLCKQSNRHSHAVHLLVCSSCWTHLLPLPSAQKVSGELNFKIRAEFARLHQILEEEERAVLAELGEKEEQTLAQLHRHVGQLEEGMAVLQRDIEHVKQTLSKMEDVSLLEVRCFADSGRRLRDISGCQIGMGES